MSLPYPGRFESHGSWMRRCDAYDADRRSWQRQQAARHSNWGGYNYHTVDKDYLYELPNGQKIFCRKASYGPRNAKACRRFAAKHGLEFKLIKWPGNGWTSRTDGIAYSKDIFNYQAPPVAILL